MDIDITKAVKVLRDGGLIVFPSDTVYGLLVDATNEKAVGKLIQFKNRPPGKAISVFVADAQMLRATVQLNKTNTLLVERFLPGPYTIVLPSLHTVSKTLESERGTLGVRIPKYAPVVDLVKLFGKPVTATSANLGGKSPHYSVTSLLNQLPESKKKLIDYIVDAGTLPRNKPSTVMDLSGESIRYLRHGDLVPRDGHSYVSTSVAQTGKIGLHVFEKAVSQAGGAPIVFVLQGDLGTGKTVIAQAIGKHLGIDKIVSPTYVVYYEYAIKNEELRKKGYELFVHADLYNIQEESEFEHLGLEAYMEKKSVMVIEWAEKLGSRFAAFKHKAHVVPVQLTHLSESEREIGCR